MYSMFSTLVFPFAHKPARTSAAPPLKSALLTISPFSSFLPFIIISLFFSITHGRIKVENAQPENLLNVLYKLKEMGCTIFINRDDITLKAPKELKSVEIETTPYPGFPTDMQPILGAVLTQANGTSIIKENIFENRFKYI